MNDKLTFQIDRNRIKFEDSFDTTTQRYDLKIMSFKNIYFSHLPAIIAFGMVLFSSCGKERHSNKSACPVIDVDVEFTSTTEDAKDFFDSYDYVVLQSDPNNPLGEIDIIKTFKDKMAIVSRESVFIYDRNGKPLHSFNKKGHGHSEYLEIQDIACNENRIYILSWMQKRILTYDFDGQYIDSYDLPYAYAAFQRTKDGFWLASESNNDSKSDFSLFNVSHKEIVADVMPFDHNQSTHATIGVFNPFVFTSDKETLVAKQYDYGIYGLDKDGDYKAWEYRFNTAKQIKDFGEDLSYAELYQALSNQPVVLWPGVLWKGNENVYQTLGIFYILGRFTNIYKFSLERPDEKGKLLHIGLKSYEDFPFLKNAVLAIQDGNYISSMSSTEALIIAQERDIDLKLNKEESEETQIIFFHHFKD